MSDRFDEFDRKCLSGDDPDAKRIEGTDKSDVAERFAKQSRYHRQAAEDLLGSRSDLIAVVEGYYAMLHKANEALARAGFKIGSHRCTILGLRGVFEASDLADTLRQAGDDRVDIDYHIDPDEETAATPDPEEFVEETVDPFIDDVDQLIDEEL